MHIYLKYDRFSLLPQWYIYRNCCEREHVIMRGRQRVPERSVCTIVSFPTFLIRDQVFTLSLTWHGMT